MKRILLLHLSLIILLLASCRKNSSDQYSGTVTINNKLNNPQSAPFIYGFSVPQGKLVSTLSDPLNVITVMADGDTASHVINQVFLSSTGYASSFFRFGQYGSAAAADEAFAGLKSFDTDTWVETADSVAANQIWLYRTADEKYAKIQITGVSSSIRTDMAYPYGECTFKWVYQPDGTRIFP